MLRQGFVELCGKVPGEDGPIVLNASIAEDKNKDGEHWGVFMTKPGYGTLTEQQQIAAHRFFATILDDIYPQD